MLVSVQLAICVFALHGPLHCSSTQPPSRQPGLQPHSQCVMGRQLLSQSLLVQHLWPSSQCLLGRWPL